MLTVRALLISAFCLLVVAVPYAQSQHLPPGGGVKTQQIKKDAATSNNPPAEDQRGTEKVPFVIKSIPAEQTPDQAEENRKERNAKASSEWWLTTYTGLLAVFTFCLIVVGSIQIGLFVWQLRLIRDSLGDTKTAANAALLTAQNMQLADRAYVKMLHCEPGLTLQKNATTEWYEVNVKVENCGKTPALVTDVRLRFISKDWGDPLPRIIDYHDEDAADRLHSAFLVPGDWFFIPKISSGDHHGAVRTNSKQLILFGYIDYIDAFGKQHRAGYAREYRAVQGNNLFLISSKGHNYDRPRKETDRQDQDTIEI